jgi:hypothetical protein
MSALGHEQTSTSRLEMSALPPKADMFSVEIDVCFVPEADINHHLFSAVVIALIRLFQFGVTVEIRPSTPWHWFASQPAAASVI